MASIAITAPSSAEEGEGVSVSVRVTNTLDYHASFRAEIYAVPDLYPDFLIGTIDQIIKSGESATLDTSFTMPDSDTTILVWVERWAFDHWTYDGSASKVVSLEAILYTGAISRKELEYDESRANIPAYDVSQNQKGLVHIWGRNDMDEAQRMGISWVVKDPDGITVEEYSAWEAWPYTGAGDNHEFIGGRFNLDKLGTYTINVGLLMNPDDPIYVDIYYGDLCTVVSAVPEIYKGTITEKELEYDETRSIIPVY